MILRAEPPVLIDEWQFVPAMWDAVRRAVDDGSGESRYFLTGSAAPTGAPTHSGAGRIIRIRMRPLSLAERGLGATTVSLKTLLTGSLPDVHGHTAVALADYAHEIVASGFPAFRHLSGRALRAQLDGYLARVVDRDFQEQGHAVRRPDVLQRWIAAYAAATATTTSLEKIRLAATRGEDASPAKGLALSYRDVLQRLWLVDPIDGWSPSRNHLGRVGEVVKHHLADPALAASALGLDEHALLTGAQAGPSIPRDGTLFGHLFESLVTLSVRVYAQQVEANVRHFRTHNGRQEVDLIVQRADHRVLLIEVKLGATITDSDVRHLVWLKEQLGDEILDMVVISTGAQAYRRPDGVAVIPAALLGP